jgi:hypothetical protein
MRRLLPIALLTAAVAMAALPSSAFAAGLVDRATMLLSTSYLLRANLSYANATISATETITLKNTSGASISKLNLSVMPRAFGELLSIGSYSVDGRATSAAWSNNANLVLQLGRNIADGGRAVVKLSFKVRASSIIGTSLEGRLSKANSIMQVSHWFPIISNGHGMRYPGDSQFTRAASKIRLELTTDSSSVRIAAPGHVVLSSGRQHIYELTGARDFAFGASPYYQTISGSAAGVKVVSYAVNGGGSTALAHARAALAKFETVFGEYQWERFVIAQTGRKGSGNEYPGIVFLGSAVYTSQEVIAHETAHQWWYAMVGNEQIKEPWLDEGLAEWAAAYFFGDFESYDSTLPVNTPSTSFPNLPSPQTTYDHNSYAQTVYFKAAKFLEGLRLRMGSTAFLAGLRALAKANHSGVMTTREFYDGMVRFGASKTYLDAFIDL